jgi:hypothetical protein
MDFQIGGRRDRHHAQRRPYPHRDHVLGDLFAKPDACVIAFGDNVGEPGLGVDLDLDIRITPEKAVDRRPEQGPCRMVRGGDANVSRGALTQLAELGKLPVDRLDGGAQRIEQPLPGVGRRDAARGPGEKPETEPGLQLAHPVAERRGRDAKARRRAREAPFLRDHGKGFEICQILPRHAPLHC